MSAITSIKRYEQQLEGIQNTFLSTLPPGYMPFDAFVKEFALGNTSTEQLHPITKQLSQVMHKNIGQGMDLLLQVDQGVIAGVEEFIPSVDSMVSQLADKMKLGGRVFLVGSGSSGRVAIDIAAQCGLKFPKCQNQVIGIIAGGDSALIRAKEGFEDSEEDGAAALKDYGLGAQDTVVLISASGSASFNVGCGHFCANEGAQVFYFYNSKNIPDRTQRLFNRENNPVIPLCVDIGPQAIGGSTRLQAATLAEACLGALLGSTLYLIQGEEQRSHAYSREILSQMSKGLDFIKNHLDSISAFAQYEADVFSDPRSNFRQLQDIFQQGYVTFLALRNSIREVLIDATETSPTFSTNPIRRERDTHKRAEFRAYLLGEKSNSQAWNTLVGREVNPVDVKDTKTFLVAAEEDGINSYAHRPVGKGNFLIGVAKLKAAESLPQQLTEMLHAAKKQGGRVGVIVTCREKLSQQQVKELKDAYDIALIMDNIPYDDIGFTETIILKQTLNLISNSSMTLMNKVHGNQMIDVRASNKKLIHRCVQLIQMIYQEYNPNVHLDERKLYYYIAHVQEMKKTYADQGTYTPSVVKIVLAMIALNKTPRDVQEVVTVLHDKQESIDWIGSI